VVEARKLNRVAQELPILGRRHEELDDDIARAPT
jgi:hypothetical protein